MYTIAFTGHRPDKLGGYEWFTPKNSSIREAIFNEIIKEVHEKKEPLHFISGGAIGVDQFAFDCVEKFKNQFKKFEVTNEIAIPFKKQANLWSKEDKRRYNEQIEDADKVTYVDTLDDYQADRPEGVYSILKMQKRNEYMVDNCDLLIAVYDGHSFGGTRNCINYAKKLGKRIIIINPDNI